MIKDVVIPEIGENIESGDVVKLLVKKGDTVQADDPILEFETDKAVVEIPAPVLRVTGDMRIPAAVSGRWLAGELGSAAAERLGDVRFTGTSGIGENPRVLSSRAIGQNPVPDERLQLTLHCASPLCVAALRRERGGEWRSGQALLLSGMSEEEWREALRQATHGLYD